MQLPKIYKRDGNPALFVVESFNKPDEKYFVSLAGREPSCECPHNTKQGKVCKHIISVYARLAQRLPAKILVNGEELKLDASLGAYFAASGGVYLPAWQIFHKKVAYTELSGATPDSEIIAQLLHCYSEIKTNGPIAYNLRSGDCIAVGVDAESLASYVHTKTLDQTRHFVHVSMVDELHYRQPSRYFATQASEEILNRNEAPFWVNQRGAGIRPLVAH